MRLYKQELKRLFLSARVKVIFLSAIVLSLLLVELLTTPADLASYKTAITEALQKGTKRNIVSEDDTKNVAVG